MNDLHEIADPRKRWEAIRHRFLEQEYGAVPIHHIAGLGGWFYSRQNDRVEDFVSLSWDQLQSLSGFGRKKIERLMNILADNQPTVSTVTDIVTELERIGVPRNFPLSLAHFSARVVEVARVVGANTAGELLECWEKHGATDLLKFQNIGRRSVTEIEAFFRATRNGDEIRLATIFPLRPASKGVFLAEGIMLAIRDISELGRRVLHRRLCENRTLESAGGGLGVSRKRVHQMERALLSSVSALLDWFQSERVEVFTQLAAGEPRCSLLFQIVDERERLLGESVVRRLFRESIERVVEPSRSAAA